MHRGTVKPRFSAVARLNGWAAVSRAVGVEHTRKGYEMPYVEKLNQNHKFVAHAIVRFREFPVDMLRYDSCSPVTERCAREIAYSLNPLVSEGGWRDVLVKRTGPMAGDAGRWTFARWASFGAHVVPLGVSEFYQMKSVALGNAERPDDPSKLVSDEWWVRYGHLSAC